MRIPIAITATIALAALFMGWRDHGRLAALQALHQEMQAAAAARGFNQGDDGSLQLPAKLPRIDRAEVAKRAAADFMTYSAEMDALDKALDAPDKATRQRIITQMEELLALDGEQLKILIGEILHAEKDPKRKEWLMRFSIGQLANRDPRQAVDLLTGDPEVGEFLRVSSSGVANTLKFQALRGWAELEPQAALDWFRDHKVAGYPLAAVIQGGAVKEPRLMLQAILESGEDPVSLMALLTHGKETMEERLLALDLIREWGAACDDPQTRQQVMKNRVSGLVWSPNGGKESFARASAWFERAELTPEELDILVGNLGYGIKLDETGLWMDWLTKKLPPDRAQQEIEELFRSWTGRDTWAASRWLDTAPESEVKRAAALGYAKLIATRDPQEAIRRALAVPDSPQRIQALRTIHQHMPTSDDASRQAADEFARQHHLAD